MEGSQFIKTLSRIIPKEAHRKDLQKITKMVNYFILVDCVSPSVCLDYRPSVIDYRVFWGF